MNDLPFISGTTLTGKSFSPPSQALKEDEIAKTLAKQLNLKTEMGLERLKVALEACKLFDRKQHDYGSRNIAFSDSQDMNAIGVAIRLNDKVQRMLNLSQKKMEGKGAEVKDESLEDTAIDICNYGAILSMLLTNRWK
jgi:hypothetical protein